MGTSAPVRRTHDIPIAVPKRDPLKLPAPGPSYVPSNPVRVPEREPVRVTV